MKKVLRLLATALTGVLILSVLWLTASSITIENKVSQAFEESNGMNKPFSIRIESADSYKITSVANIKVTVTNTSGTAIENVGAEALFDGLSPVGKNNTLKAETAILNSGESLSFNYSAMISKDNSNLNFFQKVILFFVRLFKRSVSVSDNGFNDGRVFVEERKTISFGKIGTTNTIKVWYAQNGGTTTPTTISKDYEELIKGVDIDALYDYDESDISVDEETGIGFVNNIVLIIFEDGCTDERKAEIIKSINGKVVGGRTWANELHLEISHCSFQDLTNFCDRLKKMSGVLEAYYDEVNDLSDNSISYIPNDTYKIDSSDERALNFNNYPLTWYSSNSSNTAFYSGCRNSYHLAIQTPGAWTYNDYFNNVNIGIIDSGFSTAHEDLNIQIASKGNTPNNHGTHVAGIIGAKPNNGIGSTGIVNKSSIYCYMGKSKLTTSEIYNGLDVLVREKQCRVINLSQGLKAYEIGGKLYENNNKINPLSDNDIASWSERASMEIGLLLKDNQDFIIVQSAGNGTENTSVGIDAVNNGYFCSITAENCYSKIQGVSVEKILNRIIIVANAFYVGKYQLTSDSNGGGKVDIAAPGVEIFSTVAGVKQTNKDGSTWIEEGQKYALMSGTSMAAPIVSGVASLVWSVNPNFTGADVKNIVINTAKAGNTIVYDNPSSPTTGDFYMVNAKLAVEEAIRQTYGTSAVRGYVVDADNNNEPLSDVEIALQDKATGKTITAQSEENGNFCIWAPAGEYVVTFDKTGYEEKVIETKGAANEIVDFGNVEIYQEEDNTIIGNVTGVVKDINTKEPIAGVAVNVFSDNSPITTTTTNDKGKFGVTLPKGGYAFKFTCAGYDRLDLTVGLSETCWMFEDGTAETSLFYDIGDIYLTPKDDGSDNSGYSDGIGSADDLGSLNSQGAIIKFGAYPQTKVTDTATVSALNSRASGWQSYGYYSGTRSWADGQMTAKDYMMYCDVKYGGSKYRGVTFSQYRPYVTYYTSSASKSLQDDNGYTTGTTYWFKFEPLQWKVIDSSEGLVMCVSLIDSQPYNNYILSSGTDSYGYTAYWGDAGKTHYANDYANSSLHDWLNETFYATAFTEAQQNRICVNQNQNNDGYFTLTGNTNYTDYDSDPTNDKIFLLSFTDVASTTRSAQGTDYAQCQGLYVFSSSGSSNDGNSWWWLRSPGSNSYYACSVGNGGSANYNYDVSITYFGIRPCCKINK